MPTIGHLDLCSGIGGFALAARWMGWQTVGFAEIDPFASKVLAKNFPGVPNYGDIGAIPDGVRADIITAGIPCQPYSCAGKRMGAEDDRALWPIAREVIARVRPDWIVIENVAGFIGMALDGVLSDLEAEGYECGTVVLPACAVNAPHRRDRVWVVSWNSNQSHDRKERKIQDGYSDSYGVCEDVPDSARFCERKPSIQADPIAASGKAWNESCDRHSPAADSDREPMGRATEPRRQRGGRKFESGVGRDFDGLPAELDRPIGSGPEYWEGDWERGIQRVSKKIPDRSNRLKALGNAIVPQVAYQIFKAINRYSHPCWTT